VHILIAEDEPVSRRVLRAALEKMGHSVREAADGDEALRILENDGVRLVIADWMMPNVDGLELVRRIRAGGQDPDSGESAERYTYVILLTSRGQKQDIVDGLTAGADDYITKPFDRDELMVRIHAGERVIGLEDKLAARNRELARMALVDGLTGIPNRRDFDEKLRKLGEESRRGERPFSILMIDLDRFKGLNDTLGHEAGDDALRTVAGIIGRNVRASDSAFRYGGEEFVCLLPDTDSAGAQLVAGRLRLRVEAAEIANPGDPPRLTLTISLGLATYVPDRDNSPEAVLARADQALYRAKELGRNRVVAAPLDDDAEAPADAAATPS
jgi:two-component system chemotaxis response regulator CheY